MNVLIDKLKLALKVLTFRAKQEEMLQFDNKLLLFGIFWILLVGAGRWWDDPTANIIQYTGLLSLILVTFLTTILWMTITPFKSKDVTFKHLLTFISLTSIPAILYAIPVEKFFGIETAIILNAAFLSLVSIWRVSLYFFYLTRFAKISWFTSTVCTLLPLTIVITVLWIFNLQHMTINFMGGFREHVPTIHDGVVSILSTLTLLSVFAFVPLLISYIVLIVLKTKQRKKSLESDLPWKWVPFKSRDFHQ